ncbi:DUF397 domain-containing protein [Streptomyces sp. NBC_00102]|uniref:DUF397 domain-containing protein n=1 Tax=Streptomyces sp. NBC_00102 TaxID=2975652 RepID=UPI002254F11C|nr:DUF397 domain-containing protein [Streptomyces sp. NBC_00102]MCX5395436.1 DUF397 domain-containing protein [Streptomyces sp. NBC_00102]
MPDRPAPPASPWHRSSRSTGMNNCVETAVRGPGLLHVRDSKDVDRAHLSFTAPAWSAFVAGLGGPGGDLS